MPQPLEYATPPPRDTALTLLNLAIIFNFILGGLELLNGLFRIATVAFTYWLARSAPPSPAMSLGLRFAIEGIVVFLTLAGGTLKIVAAEALRRRTRWAWPTALAAGITGCIQIWCSCCMLLTIPIGIYTIVILCMENVRTHLRIQPAGFPIAPFEPPPPPS